MTTLYPMVSQISVVVLLKLLLLIGRQLTIHNGVFCITPLKFKLFNLFLQPTK